MNQCLPDDANEIYAPFDSTEKGFFENGRRMFFQASENPESVFGKVKDICSTDDVCCVGLQRRKRFSDRNSRDYARRSTS